MCKYKRQNDELEPQDICVKQFSIHQGMKDINPLDYVTFYRPCGDNKIQKVKKDLAEISTMMPERVMTTTLRCFVKDDKKINAANFAFF